MMEWSNLSNSEIRFKMASMENEYEAIKNEINRLISELDKLDNEYYNANSELNKRMKK